MLTMDNGSVLAFGPGSPNDLLWGTGRSWTEILYRPSKTTAFIVDGRDMALAEYSASLGFHVKDCGQGFTYGLHSTRCGVESVSSSA